MVKKIRRVVMLALLSCISIGVQAQMNLILNPSFEDEPWGPYGIKHWYFTVSSKALCSLTETNPHTGSKALQIVTGTDTSITVGKTGDNGFDNLVVVGNTKYRFKFFYRGEPSRFNLPNRKTRKNLQASFTWYGDNGNGGLKSLKVDTEDEYAVVIENEWQEKIIDVVAPEGATKLKLMLLISEDVNKDKVHSTIAIDDLSLVADAPRPQAPTAPHVQVYQREAELSWTKVEGASYEVELSGQSYFSTINNMVLTGLKPDTNYIVKLRINKDGVTSDWTTTTLKTAALTTSPEDEARTPYLRTIQQGGICPAVLGLFYNELHSDTASFVYTLDGTIVGPSKQETLTLTKGEHILQVEVKESDERIYYLTYNLVVN